MYILKHGKELSITENRNGKCPYCGCEFSYTISDAISIERSTNGYHILICPESFCKGEIKINNTKS